MSNPRIAIISGSRADFGLLTPVIRAVSAHKKLELQLIAAGSHFLAPARTIRDVEAAFPVAARVPMQGPRHRTRLDDARATARGIDGFARAFARLKPDWVVVLGDRIEAFAGASAAAIAGIGVAHIHGGDRAEGIADESMRHAITKLAHLHLAATERSARRITRMGERPDHVHVVGSPAIDALRSTRPMNDRDAQALGNPTIVILLHPSGLDPRFEELVATELASAATILAPTLFLAPNHDAERDAIDRVWRRTCQRFEHAHYSPHLPREQFLALLARMTRRNPLGGSSGLLVGNSSAGLIEAAALRVPVINIGPRQAGREQGANVSNIALDPASFDPLRFFSRLQRGFFRFVEERPPDAHPYGDGRAGPRIARLLASTDPHDPALFRKRNTY